MKKKKISVCLLLSIFVIITSSCSTALVLAELLLDVGELALSSSGNYSSSSSADAIYSGNALYSGGSVSSETSSGNAGNYEIMYRNWESRARSNYNSLMSASSSGGTYTAQKHNLNEAQQEMRRIRTDAAQHGVSISPSQWETATVSISGADGSNVHKTGTHRK